MCLYLPVVKCKINDLMESSLLARVTRTDESSDCDHDLEMSMSLHLSGMQSFPIKGSGSTRCSLRFLSVATICSSLRCPAWVLVILLLFNRLPQNSDLNNNLLQYLTTVCIVRAGLSETILQFYKASKKTTGIWLGDGLV